MPNESEDHVWLSVNIFPFTWSSRVFRRGDDLHDMSRYDVRTGRVVILVSSTIQHPNSFLYPQDCIRQG